MPVPKKLLISRLLKETDIFFIFLWVLFSSLLIIVWISVCTASKSTIFPEEMPLEAMLSKAKTDFSLPVRSDMQTAARMLLEPKSMLVIIFFTNISIWDLKQLP